MRSAFAARAVSIVAVFLWASAAGPGGDHGRQRGTDGDMSEHGPGRGRVGRRTSWQGRAGCCRSTPGPGPTPRIGGVRPSRVSPIFPGRAPTAALRRCVTRHRSGGRGGQIADNRTWFQAPGTALMSSCGIRFVARRGGAYRRDWSANESIHRLRWTATDWTEVGTLTDIGSSRALHNVGSPPSDETSSAASTPRMSNEARCRLRA